MGIQEIVNLFLPRGTDELGDVIGPQGDVIDKLEVFNTKYMMPDNEVPLKITKKWRWAPGTYDRVKKAYTRKIMQWHRRPRHMKSLFDRERTWYKNDMKRELINIEDQLITARQTNAIWLDADTDSGLLEQVTAEFAYKIMDLENVVSKYYDSIEIHPAQNRELQHIMFHRDHPEQSDSLDIADGKFIITVKMPTKPIEVTKDGEIIGSVPFPALTLSIRVDVPRWIGHSISPQNVSEHNMAYENYFNISVYYEVPSKDYTGDEDDDKMFGGREWPIYHPFINQSGYSNTAFRPWNWRNICWGSYGNQIINSFMSMDFDAFFLFIEKWLYQYEMIGANPLNNIRLSFLGVGIDTSDEMLDVVGYDGADCSYKLRHLFPTDKEYSDKYDTTKVMNYCDNVRECSLRLKGLHQCRGYQQTTVMHKHSLLVLSMIGDPIEDRLSGPEALSILKGVRNHFDFNGRYPYYGTDNIYAELEAKLYDHNQFLTAYTDLFRGQFLQLSDIDQTVLAYLIVNKYWEAYIEIIAFSYLKKSNYQMNEKDLWVETMIVTKQSVDQVIEGIITKMNQPDVVKSEADIAADNTREDMIKWANEVSNGRITRLP